MVTPIVHCQEIEKRSLGVPAEAALSTARVTGSEAREGAQHDETTRANIGVPEFLSQDGAETTSTQDRGATELPISLDLPTIKPSIVTAPRKSPRQLSWFSSAFHHEIDCT